MINLMQQFQIRALYFDFRLIILIFSLHGIQKRDTLYVKFNYARQLKTSDGQPLRGFALEDAKGRQQDVDARISRNEVLIPLSKEANPFTLLYGWTPYSTANLQNEAGLPASTFRLPVEKKE